tara:strand:- start:1029 stop:1253 length:225 start_codon:yes stop_codon:yes gene_type:complete
VQKDKEKIAMNIILKTLKLKKNKISLNTSLGSIPEWDSLAHLNIFMNLNSVFKKIDIKKASKVVTIKDWLKLVK